MSPQTKNGDKLFVVIVTKYFIGNSFLLAMLYEYDVKNVTIPYSVNFLGNMPIWGCTSLTSIKYNGTKEE